MKDDIDVSRLIGVRLVDFKSFADEHAALTPFTLLVGGNAAGKSNFLDSLRFLHGLGLGLAAPEILVDAEESPQPPWSGLRGGAREAARFGLGTFRVETTWLLSNGAEIIHAVSCETSPDVVIAAERLEVVGEDEPLLNGTNLTRGKQADCIDETIALHVQFRTLPGARYVIEGRTDNLTMLAHAPRSEDGMQAVLDPRVVPYSQALRRALRQLLFLELDPSLMRRIASMRTKTMGARGENLAAAAWHLCKDEEQKQNLLDWLSELVEPRIEDIRFPVFEEAGDVMLELIEAGGTRVTARSLSDGTLRFLGILVALMTAPTGSVLLIEEIENGLHPARAALLVELIGSVAADRGCQVIGSTHSPQVLLALQNLSREELGHALVFGRTPDVEGTIVRRLADLPHFAEVAAKRGVDYLFTTQWLEHAL